MATVAQAMTSLPVLYSFRRCPYAMRARMALLKADIRCELREVMLKDKPQALLDVSAKGTVPVLVASEHEVVDQSLAIVYWALQRHDPNNWLQEDNEASRALVKENDGYFKHYLDRYKYHVGYPEHPPEYYREQASTFLQVLEERLDHNDGRALANAKIAGLADIAIFPFVRQFANVDLDWFQSSPYPLLKDWYRHWADSDLFQACMKKYSQWQAGQTPVYFPA